MFNTDKANKVNELKAQEFYRESVLEVTEGIVSARVVRLVA